MTSFDTYKYFLGESIMLYQLIEHDIKVILACMKKGDIQYNLADISSSVHGLGECIRVLEELDRSDNQPFFQDSDYQLLKKVARKRNYYCHQCSMDFIYEPDFLNGSRFHDAFEELKKDHDTLLSIQAETEKAKALAFRKYR